MIEQTEILGVIGLMALVVYLTRVGGYLIGLQMRHIGRLRPVLETLPGCAFMAILVPAVRQGNAIEMSAMLAVALLMWKTDNVVLASAVGMIVLIFGDSLLLGINTSA